MSKRRFTNPDVEWEIGNRITECVRDGRQHDLIQIFPDAGTNAPPERVGEWGLIVIHGYHPETREPQVSVVAKPLSVRTRAYYEEGCVKFLMGKGFTEADAKDYYAVSRRVPNAWVDQVIELVHSVVAMKIDEDVLLAISKSSDPRAMARKIGVMPTVYNTTFKRFHAAMELLLKFYEKKNKDLITAEQERILQAA